jgi:biopolymer transport protein ExbD
MKKIHLFVVLLFLSSATFLTSCQKDEVLNPEPSINFKGGSTYTSADVSIKAGESITVGINAAQNADTKSKLKTFTVVLTQNNTPVTLINNTLDENQEAVYSQDFVITFPNVGEVSLVARVTDADGKFAEVSFKVTVEQAGVAVKKKTNVEFGSFNDAIGSFYATSNETVYTISGAANNQAIVNIIFFKGSVNGNTLAAPDDTDAATIDEFNLDTWTTKKKTRFIKVSMTAAEFDAIGSVYSFPEFSDASASSKANQLAAGNVIYFKTEEGKRGYAKVIDLYLKGDKAKFDFIVEN